ncbi:MAG: 2-oxo acid dehydrogenase subunit E2 [Oscillospiraceae bacterium]|nr:2-oxo acid dehydrogenase subunit E2 [Oscillospiraceae bacterium]
MATAIIMPKVGISVESCIITKWHKQKGDAVKAGDLLFSYETDKTSVDEEAKESGTLLEILAQEGDDVPVLETVCVIGAPGEDISALVKSAQSKAAAPAQEAEKAVSVAAAPAAAPAAPVTYADTDKIKASPRAKALAEKAGIDLRSVAGTGPGGRIIERDIQAAAKNGPLLTGAALAAGENAVGVGGTGIGGRVTVADLRNKPAAAAPDTGEVEIVKFTTIRKAIAKSMLQSLSSMAQLTNQGSFDATNILQYRAVLKASKDETITGITLNDILLYAVSRTLKNHRDLNAHLIGEELHRYRGVHVGVAVDTPRGLIVPTLRDADSMSLAEISVNAKKLIQEAVAGTISPDLLKGGTFTVTNLGTLGVESFTPVINPPQTGILGVCAVVERVRTVDGAIRSYPSMGLSLTYDHRAVDGAPAARFVMELKQNLEAFTELLAK